MTNESKQVKAKPVEPGASVLPAEVGVTLTTNRADFARALAAKVRSGIRAIPAEQVAGLIDLVAAMAESRGNDLQRINRLLAVQKRLIDAAKGIDKAVAEARTVLGAIQRDEPLREGEED